MEQTQSSPPSSAPGPDIVEVEVAFESLVPNSWTTARKK
jgi:hypothetical protein